MTLIIDTASLIGGGILLLLVLAATLTDVFLRKSRRTENPLVAHEAEEVQTTSEDHEADKVKEMAEPSCDYPPVSIIVTPHDKAPPPAAGAGLPRPISHHRGILAGRV